MSNLFTSSNLIFSFFSSIVIVLVLIFLFNKQKDMPDDKKIGLFSLKSLISFVGTFFLTMFAIFLSESFAPIVAFLIFFAIGIVLLSSVFFSKLLKKN